MDCLSCPLCLETCRVPVEITGFPCYSTDTIHCHSMIRYCKVCCIKLFELDRPRQDRKHFLKCLFCDTSVNPQLLESVPFRTDHFLICRDITCSLSCPSCDYVAPDHQALEKHCSQQCLNALRVSCSACGVVESVSQTHACLVDEEGFPPSEDIVNMTVCSQCSKSTLLSMEEHLESECLLRLVPCKYCKERVPAIHFTDHLLFHREESKHRSELLGALLVKEREWGQRILQECREFYGDTFEEAM